MGKNEREQLRFSRSGAWAQSRVNVFTLKTSVKRKGDSTTAPIHRTFGSVVTLGNDETFVEIILGQVRQSTDNLAGRPLPVDRFPRVQGRLDVVQEELQHLGVKTHKVQLALVHKVGQGHESNAFYHWNTQPSAWISQRHTKLRASWACLMNDSNYTQRVCGTQIVCRPGRCDAFPHPSQSTRVDLLSWVCWNKTTTTVIATEQTDWLAKQLETYYTQAQSKTLTVDITTLTADITTLTEVLTSQHWLRTSQHYITTLTVDITTLHHNTDCGHHNITSQHWLRTSQHWLRCGHHNTDCEYQSIDCGADITRLTAVRTSQDWLRCGHHKTDCGADITRLTAVRTSQHWLRCGHHNTHCGADITALTAVRTSQHSLRTSQHWLRCGHHNTECGHHSTDSGHQNITSQHWLWTYHITSQHWLRTS